MRSHGRDIHDLREVENAILSSHARRTVEQEEHRLNNFETDVPHDNVVLLPIYVSHKYYLKQYFIFFVIIK